MLGVVAIAVAISLMVIIVPEIFGQLSLNRASDYFSMPLGFIAFLLVIVASFFGSSSLLAEFHEKTGYSLFPNPVSRTSIWFGKFLAAELVSFFVVGIYFGIVMIATFFKYQVLPEEVFFSLGFSLVALTTIMSISFLVGAVFRGPTAAVILVFFLFILILPMIDQLLISVLEVKPWFTPTFSEKIIQNIMIDPYPIDLAPGELPRGPFDVNRFVPYVRESLLVMIAYIVISSIVSIVIYKRREMS